MTDEEIDTSDIPALTEEFFQNAQLRLPDGTRRPLTKKPGETATVSLTVAPETLAFFQASGQNAQRHMETVLADYANAHKNAAPDDDGARASAL